ncbi:MAG: hypothetical protein ABIS03_03330 [Gemmatimonadaceae bacterium]
MRYPCWLLIVPVLGCSLPAPTPPSAEFLVAAAGATYWVKSGPRGISSRTSPLILTSADNHFYEVYIDEVSRSYEDAIFSAEPIYSRDLLSGRQRLLWEEPRVADWEKAYLRQNPKARLLDADEDGDEEVSTAATSEADILAVVGPFVLYDRRISLERGDYQRSDSSRGALDVRSGATVPLEALVRDSAVLGAGAVREGPTVRWRHAGYDVLVRWDDERAESQVVLRDMRGHEWPLGYLSTRLPRVFWLDEPRVDDKLRSALATAFDRARADDTNSLLVHRRRGKRTPGIRLATHSPSAITQPRAISQ